MSSSELKAQPSELQKRVLLYLAEILGPGMDRVDPEKATRYVRDVVLEFEDGGKLSPAEVRHALLKLIAGGLVAGDQRCQQDPELFDSDRDAARLLRPGVGQKRRCARFCVLVRRCRFLWAVLDP